MTWQKLLSRPGQGWRQAPEATTLGYSFPLILQEWVLFITASIFFVERFRGRVTHGGMGVCG